MKKSHTRGKQHTHDDEGSKYFMQRRLYFSRYDQGCELDEESWYSITPEVIAAHIAQRCRCRVLVDACCGVGGNAIQFAKVCDHVIAIDIDGGKIELAKKNAAIYGVQDKIEFIQGDVRTVLTEELKGRTIDVIYIAPPWGGPDYWQTPTYNIERDMPFPLVEVIQLAKAICPNIAVYLPFNTDAVSVARLAELPALATPCSSAEATLKPDSEVTHEDCKCTSVRHVVPADDDLPCVSQDTSHLSFQNVSRFMPEPTTWSKGESEYTRLVLVPGATTALQGLQTSTDASIGSKRLAYVGNGHVPCRASLAGEARETQDSPTSVCETKSHDPVFNRGPIAQKALEWLVSKPGAPIVCAIPLLQERIQDLVAEATPDKCSQLWRPRERTVEAQDMDVNASLNIDIQAEHVSARQFYLFLNHLTAFSRVRSALLAKGKHLEQHERDTIGLEATSEHTNTQLFPAATGVALTMDDNAIAQLIHENVWVLTHAKELLEVTLPENVKRVKPDQNCDSPDLEDLPDLHSSLAEWIPPEVRGTAHLYTSRQMKFATGEVTWCHVIEALRKSPLLRRIRHALWINQLRGIQRETLLRKGRLVTVKRGDAVGVTQSTDDGTSGNNSISRTQLTFLSPRRPGSVPRMPFDAPSLLLCPCVDPNRLISRDIRIEMSRPSGEVDQQTWQELIPMCEVEVAAANGTPKAMVAYYGALVRLGQ